MKLLKIKNFVFNTLLVLANICIFFLSEGTLGYKAAGQSEERGVKIKGQEEEEEKQFPVL